MPFAGFLVENENIMACKSLAGDISGMPRENQQHIKHTSTRHCQNDVFVVYFKEPFFIFFPGILKYLIKYVIVGCPDIIFK